MAMDEAFEALVDWLRTFPDFPSTVDPTTNDGAIAVAKIVEELCDVPIFKTLSEEQLCNTDVMYQFLKAVTDRANTADRSSYADAPPYFVVLVNLLDCAVHAKDKERRRIYVGRMMGLPGKSQKIIMKMIEQARSNGQSAAKRPPPSHASPQVRSAPRQSAPQPLSATRPSSRLSPPRTTNKKDAMTPPQSSKRLSMDLPSPYKSPPPRSSSIGSSPSVGFLSPGTRESPQRLQSIVVRQQREIDELREKLRAATDREEDLSESLAQQEQKHRQAMMSMETQSLSKFEEVQSTLENRVAELQDTIESLSAEAQKGGSAIHQLAALKEELAIHEGNQSQLEEANKKLHAAKSKLQELADVKGALLKEQEAHGKAVDSIVNLENEVNHLRPIKRQVETCKKRAIDAEIRLVECQDCLKRLEKKANDENAHIFKDMMMQKSHLAELRQRILDDTKTPSTEVQNGIGEGLSELNPQLKEELARLRNENVRLRAFQSQRSDDAVQQLEESLENAERLVEQYKSNHLSTKETLRQTQDQLAQSEQREKHLEYALQQLESKLQDYEENIGYLENQCSSISEELSNAREECSRERMSNSMLQKTVADLQHKNRLVSDEGLNLQQRLTVVSDELDTARRQLGHMEATANSLNATNEKLKDELLIKHHELESNDTILKDTSSQLAALHNAVVEKDNETDRLQRELSELQKSSKALTSELEQERSARNQDAEEAQKALESTRSILEQKLVTDMKELQENMNSLLEDERNDNRNKQRQAQELISSQESKWKEECKKLKEQLDQIRHRYKTEEKKLRVSIESERIKLESDARKLSEGYESQIEALRSEIQETKAEHQAEIENLKEECERKKDDIVHKGKEMMTIAKAKATELLMKERHSYNEVVETCNNLNDRLMAAANEIEEARNEIDETHREIEKYKDKVSAVERERSKFQEENEQFRRQLSGRQYADSHDAQSRLEKVTKELSILHEEHRKLKRSVRNKQLRAIAEGEESTPYGRSGVADNHAIQQITQEYEKKLSDLQEEKRELIMKNSAQVTDITRTEMKVHECEKAIQFLKSENTSLKLQIKRAEFSYEESNENDVPTASTSATVQGFSPAKVSHSSPSKIPRSSPSKLPRRTSPSIDRAKRQKATSEEYLRSRITGMKSQSPPNILSPVQSMSKAKSTSPKPPPSSGLKVPSPSRMAYDVHRLNAPETPQTDKTYTISQAMEQNSSSPKAEDPGECTQS